MPGDLAIKAGKFRSQFGRHNALHTHDIPQITRPLAHQAFFGHEGLASVGAAASWIVPNPMDTYIEFTGELINADGGEEAPILGGPNAEHPAVVARLKLFEDVGDTCSVEFGGSYLFTRTSRNTDHTGHVVGADAMFQWLDPEAQDSHSVLVQGEVFWAANDVADPMGDFRNRSWGSYAFAQYQFARDWYAGVRGDYTEFPDSEDRGPDDSDWAASGYVTFYLTEFLRLRFEYQHRDFEIGGISDDEENFFLNLTYVFGAHPPHPYWVNR